MAKIVLTDTGFWIGLVDPTDQFIKKSEVILLDDSIYKANALEEVFQLNKIVGFTYSLNRRRNSRNLKGCECQNKLFGYVQ